MIFIVVKFPIRPDKLDEWERVREEHTRGARSEEGCLFSTTPAAWTTRTSTSAWRPSATTTRPCTT